MKKISSIISCLTTAIKNYFFINSKTDLSHGCEELLIIEENQVTQEEIICEKEYLEKYNVTTRWQTL